MLFPFSLGGKHDSTCSSNGRRTCAHTITSVEGRGRRFRIGFGDETFRIGRLAVTGLNADGSGVSTKTCLYLASQGYNPAELLFGLFFGISTRRLYKGHP